MSIRHQVLGAPGRDNALFAWVDSGQAVGRLLFDCGEGCLADLAPSEVQAVDHLFFSHLHMDHIGGFDSFFRRNFHRDTRPNTVWGPPETATILHHRFRGFWWNLHAGQPGTWRVHDIGDGEVMTSRFEIADAFGTRHNGGACERAVMILDAPFYTVEALRLEHLGPSLAYLAREKPKQNVDTARLAALGLEPGPWLKSLKDPDFEAPVIEVGGKDFGLAELRGQVLVESAGESIAYLTDFLLDDEATDRLAPWLRGCGTLICEAQYRHDDIELARRNHHATTRLVARLARRAEVSRLVLFHLSDRYTEPQWLEMLAECREIFPAAAFPDHWNLGL